MLNNEHSEPDFGTAAFLQVRGFRLLGLSPIRPGRYAFRFSDPEGRAEESAMAYLAGEPVAGRAFFEAEKSLKTLLYSRKGNLNGNYKQTSVHQF